MLSISKAGNSKGDRFMHSAYKNLLDQHIEAVLCPDLQSIKARFADNVPLGDFGGKYAYANPIGGWAEATRGVEAGHKQIRKLGGEIRAGCEVIKLMLDGRQVRGVVLKSGEEIMADLVVVSHSCFRRWRQVYASPTECCWFMVSL